MAGCSYVVDCRVVAPTKKVNVGDKVTKHTTTKGNKIVRVRMLSYIFPIVEISSYLCCKGSRGGMLWWVVYLVLWLIVLRHCSRIGQI